MVYVIMAKDFMVYGELKKKGERVKTDQEMAERLVMNGAAKFQGKKKPESAMMERGEKAVMGRPKPKGRHFAWSD